MHDRRPSAASPAQKDRRRKILRSISGPLPARAAVSKITVRVMLQSIVGVDPFTTHGALKVDIRKGWFSDDPALNSTDFQAAASLNNAGNISNVLLPGNWYEGILSNTARPYINKDGLTQFRLRFALDDNDNMSPDQLLLYSGNAIDPSFYPQLIVDYQPPGAKDLVVGLFGQQVTLKGVNYWPRRKASCWCFAKGRKPRPRRSAGPRSMAAR